jgi:hypothetical protein
MVPAQVAQGAKTPVVQDGQPVENSFVLEELRALSHTPLARSGRQPLGVGRVIRKQALLPGRVAVYALGVGQKDERLGSEDDVVLLLVTLYNVTDPLLARASHLLLYESNDAALCVHIWGLREKNVIVCVLRAHLKSSSAK